METFIQKFNKAVPLPFRLLLIVGIGWALREAPARIMHNGWATAKKITGKATICPWSRIVSYYNEQADFTGRWEEMKTALSVVETSPDGRLNLIATPSRQFWVKNGDGPFGGLDYLLTEHAWVWDELPEARVQPGDIVIDCGAHIGSFAGRALDMGASVVVAIDPDPVNVECLRKTFENEIAKGRLIVVDQGVWSNEGVLTFYMGDSPTLNTAVEPPKQGYSGVTSQMPVTTIDRLAESLALPRVDYIKMDIEGGEREALKGATKVLATYKPRLFLDSYHRPDDTLVFPRILQSVDSAYRVQCGPCEPIFTRELLVPHSTYWTAEPPASIKAGF